MYAENQSYILLFYTMKINKKCKYVVYCAH